MMNIATTIENWSNSETQAVIRFLYTISKFPKNFQNEFIAAFGKMSSTKDKYVRDSVDMP